MKTQQPIKHVVGLSGALAALLMVVAVIATTPAIGGNKPLPTQSGTATLTAVGDEPSASGAAKLDGTGTLVGSGGDLILKCAGLTPNANYVVTGARLANFAAVANKAGNLSLSSTFKSYGLPSFLSVYRVEPSTNILVLSGPITWNQQKQSDQIGDVAATAAVGQPFNATYVVTTFVAHDGYYDSWAGTGTSTVVGNSSYLVTFHISGKKDQGYATITAANGGLLYLTFMQTLDLGGPSGVGPFTITGGTGRFANASGSGTATATPNPDGSENNTYTRTISFWSVDEVSWPHPELKNKIG